ncbi:MAG: response regulator [Variovorax sp.]|nr:response regulator [Variovorax sp.]
MADVAGLSKPTRKIARRGTLFAMTTRIYLVEDNLAARSALTDALRATGQSEVVGASGTEKDAVTWLASKPDAWDVAVIDLLLPQGSGFSALQKIRKTRGQRVAVVTNLVTPEVRERCMAWGADAVFDKVQDIDALLTYCAGPG